MNTMACKMTEREIIHVAQDKQLVTCAIIRGKMVKHCVNLRVGGCFQHAVQLVKVLFCANKCAKKVTKWTLKSDTPNQDCRAEKAQVRWFRDRYKISAPYTSLSFVFRYQKEKYFYVVQLVIWFKKSNILYCKFQRYCYLQSIRP